MNDDEFTTYITPGCVYDHLALKAVYYRACNDLRGTAFRRKLHKLYRDGILDMPRVRDRHGDKVDFFTAVIAAHPEGHREFKLVDGVLAFAVEAVAA